MDPITRKDIVLSFFQLPPGQLVLDTGRFPRKQVCLSVAFFLSNIKE
jgi:hypothetical protein